MKPTTAYMINSRFDWRSVAEIPMSSSYESRLKYEIGFRFERVGSCRLSSWRASVTQSVSPFPRDPLKGSDLRTAMTLYSARRSYSSGA
jgi:hypothetical protein